jgi:hypothetical protein
LQSTHLHHEEYAENLNDVPLKKLKAVHDKCHDKLKHNQHMTYYSKELNDGFHIFVFGSNLAGRHGKGAALTAKHEWGAINGMGVGRTGMAYGIPTKDERLNVLGLSKIKEFVNEFVEYAWEHPELAFLVTRVGCGLSGYSDGDIAPMFQQAPINCILPDVWKNI